MMQKMMVAAGFAAALTAGTVGCKTAPKLAWWKSGETPDVEATAIAHSAPTLPADIAKEAENLASTSPSIQMSAPSTAGASGMAAPFTPSSSPATTRTAPVTTTAAVASPYPSTGAAAYNQTSSTQPSATKTASNSPSPAYYSADTNADLGAIGMPYNPNAVPPAKNVATTQSTTPAAAPNTSSDRYALANTTPSYNSSAATSPSPQATSTAQPASAYETGDRYGSYQPQTAPEATQVAPTPDSTLASMAAGNSTAEPVLSGNRYATTSTPTTTTPPAYAAPPVDMTASAAVTPTPTTPAPTTQAPTTSSMANVSPYRPGGTGTYQSGSSAVEVATRPKVTTESSVPNVATPGASTEPSEAPRYR